jgi:two-component sensor histidine kinase
VRLREKEMITKDATIREIHHRVKNNLQTVASLLRIQTRRTHSDVVKEALSQAMRRVAAIAVVHDTLSEGLSQNVDFDVVLERVLLLVAEVAWLVQRL